MMNRIAILCLLVFVADAFVHNYLKSQRLSQNLNSFPINLNMKAGGDEFVVCGINNGVAESIAIKLMDAKCTVTTVLTSPPSSPVLKAKAKDSNSLVLYCDSDRILYDAATSRPSRFSFRDLLEQKILIAAVDAGDQKATKDENELTDGEVALSKLMKDLPTTISSVILSAKIKRNDAGSNIFGRVLGQKTVDETLATFCGQNNIPISCFRFGQLVGGTPGKEPVPFMGLPSLEPELHPSYVLGSVVFSSVADNKYASTELCTRDSLATAVSKFATRHENKQMTQNSVDAVVVGIAGSPPSEKDWNDLFARLFNTQDVELLRVEFKAINKSKAFTSWIAESWFPQALIDADAATILTGSRPVRATKTSDSTVQIKWEDIQSDMTVKSAGALEIKLNMVEGSVPSINVIRLATKPLPGESLLMDKLVEAINKVAYKKMYCTPV